MSMLKQKGCRSSYRRTRAYSTTVLLSALVTLIPPIASLRQYDDLQADVMMDLTTSFIFTATDALRKSYNTSST